MKKRIFSAILAVLLLLSVAPSAFAASREATSAAETLYDLGLFKGVGTGANGKPTFDLDRVPNRMEAVTMLVRLLGKEETAQGSSWRTPFTDVADWAKPYVGYAYAIGATNGTGATTFGSSSPVTASQFLTFVLRALGYESGKDFPWNAAWVLSDKIGLTNGQYSASNDNRFTRGDAAMVSLAALSCTLKNDARTLADTLGVVVPVNPSDMTREAYLTRKLTDAQLSALRNAAPETLRQSISTVADAYAWLEQFGTKFSSGIGWGAPYLRGLEAIEAIEVHRRKDHPMTAAELYTAITSYFLADDVSGIQIGAAALLTGHNNIDLSVFLCLPVNGGYWITVPVLEEQTGSFYRVEDTIVPTLSNLHQALVFPEDAALTKLFLVDGAMPETVFMLTETDVVVHRGSARTVYTAGDQAIQDRNDQYQQMWEAEVRTRTPAYFGIPEELSAGGLTYDDAKALVGKDPAVIAASVTSVGDMMMYLMAARFIPRPDGVYTPWYGEYPMNWAYCAGGDQQILLNYGCCCGGFANVPSYLLQGDYEKVGILRWIGGGNHTISWVYTQGYYYVFDLTELINGGSYTYSGSPIFRLERLEDFYHTVSQNAYGFPKDQTVLMVAFETDGRGGMPYNWQDPPTFPGLTFPEEYRGKVLTLYQKDPDKGVKYQPLTIQIPGWSMTVAEWNAARGMERWKHLMDNWSSYQMPEHLRPSLTLPQLQALVGKDLDTVAAGVKTLGDAMGYLALSGYEAEGFDLVLPTEREDFFWHFNHSPQAVFRNNDGCCGETAGLLAYLLEGDYTVTGIVNMTFVAGEGGGHVVNYLFDGSRYYIFDPVNLVSSGFRADGFHFVQGNTLKGASDLWCSQTGWNEKLVWAYQAFDGDAPIGWDNSNISYLPSDYKDTAVILLETPAQGYVYQWVDLSDEIWDAIRYLRNQS